MFDVAVFGVPNEEFGEEAKALVPPRDMAEAEAGAALEQSRIAFCRRHWPAVKGPRSVDFLADLPRHPTGSPDKRLLCEKSWAGHAGRLV